MEEFNNTTRSVASGPKDRMEKVLHGETNVSYTSANINEPSKEGR
jgi:hypothetical protein